MNRTLRYRDDRTFTIVQFTDVHWQNGETEDLRSRDLMRKVIQKEKPDLIVFTGDIIYSMGCRDPRLALREAVSVAEESGIPWAAVFGNHDAEGNVTREELMAEMRKHAGCLAEEGPADVHGTGNYVLRVLGGSGRTGAALYFLDSGAYSEAPSVPGYDWIRTNQIQWYAARSAKLAEENGRKGVPSLAFFHIPLPEYEEVWRTQICLGRRYENVCCPRVNSGLFAAMSVRGDMMGTFCGHDHINDYGGKLLNTRLYYGRASGYHTYGRWNFQRGARVIRLKEGETDFETWVRLHDGRKLDNPPVHRPWMHWISKRLRKML